MSKKILKRSLALGALMAFVITGSAMAADLTVETEGVGISNVDGKGKEVFNSGEYGDVTVTSGGNGICMYGNSNNTERVMSVTANTMTITVGDGTAVMTSGDHKNASLKIAFDESMNIVANNKAHGIVANSSGGSIDIDGKGTGSLSVIAAENAVSTSRYDYVDTSINIHDVVDVYIESKGEDEGSAADRGNAIAAYKKGSSISIDASRDIIVKAIAGKNAIKADSDARVNLIAGNNITIDGTVQGADGLKSQIDIKGNNVTITAKATAPSETEGAVRNVSIEAKGIVTINAEGLCGVGAGPDKATMAQAINKIIAKEINITSDNAFGVYANNHSYHAVGTRVHSYLEAETINIVSKKDGIYASNGAVTEVKGFKTLNVTSEEQGIGSEYGHLTFVGGDVKVTSTEEGIRSKLGGDLKFETDLLKIDSKLESIKLTGDSVLNIDSKVVQLDGDIKTETAEEKNPILNVAFNGSASYLNGKVTTAEGSQTNLTFNDGAIWNVSGASNVTTLKCNEGKLVFTEDTAHVDVDGGSGSIILTEEGKTADNFNTAAQLTTVAEKFGISKSLKENEDLTAKVVIAEGTVRGETTGVVSFENQKENDKDFYYHGVVNEVTEKANTTNSSISEMHSVALMAWRAENNDMNKRLGELRDANGEHGAWVRMTRGESEYKSVKNQYNAYQMGYDQKVGDWTVGTAVTYTEADTGFAKGNGENKHTGLALYGSKLNNDGTYVDLIAKYAKLDHEYNTTSGIGSGDYDTDGFALSAEYGKRIEKGNGLWIEPQVELTYGLVDSVDFKAANGTVSLDDMNSLVGRIGFRAGKDIAKGNVYVRASYLYDFEGETDIIFSDGQDTRKFEQDLGGGWWEVGVGTNINLSKATYIYADIEKTFGGEVDTNWQWNLGVRYSF